MTTMAATEDRRRIVAQYMMHHINSPTQIAADMQKDYPGIDKDTVANDMKAIRRGTKGWVAQLAKDGYVFDIMIILEKLKNQERELEAMKQQSTDPKEKRSIMRQIAELCIARANIEAEGPTLLALSNKTQ